MFFNYKFKKSQSIIFFKKVNLRIFNKNIMKVIMAEKYKYDIYIFDKN
jgi:hypothetical protein